MSRHHVLHPFPAYEVRTALAISELDNHADWQGTCYCLDAPCILPKGSTGSTWVPSFTMREVG
jgi:hypothetical protein